MPDLEDQARFERVISRAMNYVSHGERKEFHLRYLPSQEGRLRAIHKGQVKETVLG